MRFKTSLRPRHEILMALRAVVEALEAVETVEYLRVLETLLLEAAV